MGDEFVLTHASLKSSDSASTASEAKPPAAGMQNTFGKVYRATGDKEESLKTYVGQRVQVTGTFKDSEDATRELGATGTSGSSAAAKPTVANSPEFTIQSVTPTSGSCTPAK
jgi:hypothetical protein